MAQRFLTRYNTTANSYSPVVWGASLTHWDGSQYRFKGFVSDGILLCESLSWNDYLTEYHIPVIKFPNVSVSYL